MNAIHLLNAYVKKAVLILLLVVMYMGMSSCVRIKLKTRMREIMQLEIALPNQLFKVENGMLSLYRSGSQQCATMVIYYGKDACSECKINHLYELIPIYEASEKYGNFEVLTIFSPAPDEIESISGLILSCAFKYPLYIDMNNDFEHLNPDFPEEEMFHSILIDSKGKPVFIGNPVQTVDLWNTFKSAVVTIGQ